MDRNTFKENAKKRIDEIFAGIETLEAKKDKAQAHVQSEYAEQIAALKARKKDLESKYQSALEASEDKWEASKSAFNESMDAFKDGFSKLSAVFS